MSAAMRRLSEAIVNAFRNSGPDAESGIPLPTNLGPTQHKLTGSSSSASSSFVEGDSTVVVDDTIYEDYDPQRIRELRRSWPQTAQETEYRFGINVRGKQQKAENDLHSKVSSLESTLSNDAATTSTEATSHGSFDSLNARQVVNWEVLPEETVAIMDRSTVWNGGSGLFDIEQNDAELQRIVSLFSIARASKRFSIGKGVRESVLDHKRSTAVSVAMKRMRLQPSKFGKLAWALRDMNESYLTPTAVDIMMKASVWATPKEIEDMKVRMRDGHELADPDALLWFLATSVPDTQARLSALSFRYEFDELLGEMIRATSLIKAASLEVCTSELLKRLMRVILLVGNNINETYGGTAAWGISLTSLNKLTTVRTTDKSLTVLDCIVSYLDQMAPETFGVADDCTCVPSAAKYSIASESKILKDARRGLEAVRKIRAMERFYLSASKKLDDIEREMRMAKEAFDKCLDHFCVPRGSMDTNNFFGYLSEFFDDFDKAIAALEAKQKQSAFNAQARSGLMNPAFMKLRRESSLSFHTAGSRNQSDSVYNPRPSAARPSIFGRMKPAKDS